MITFFACPKPFQGHTDIIQRNAIESWTLLRPKPEVILLGIDKGIAEICQEFGLIHIAEVDRNEYGTPLVNSIFQIGQARANHSVVCYINSDIMLMSDFMRAVEIVAARMPTFLILGQRWDVDVTETWNFDSIDWEKTLQGLLLRKGKLHEPNGIDFFCFPRDMFTDIPPFAIGRFAWDNWLVWQAWAKGVPLVDITEAVAVVHQNHEYAASTIRKINVQHFGSRGYSDPSGTRKRIHGYSVELGPEVQRNVSLVPNSKNLNIWASTWMLNKKGRVVRRWQKLTPSYLYYQLKCIAPLYWPTFGRLVRLMLTAKAALLKERF